MSDPYHEGGYRSREEVEEWKAKDPIPRARREILRQGILGEEELRGIERGAGEAIEQACRFALESPYPTREELFQDVYAR